MPVSLLDEHLIFPHPLLREPDGLLAFGFDLDPERLLLAYRWGIFPWYAEGQPVLWWSTTPRPVVRTDQLHISASMRKVIRQERFRITYNTAFESVIRNCATIPRAGQEGTWITPEMIEAYSLLHTDGWAHSVEVWDPGTSGLVGGVYGIGLGHIFFGESMFSRMTNASKTGFIALAERLRECGVTTIDCQLDTQHLQSLGSFTMTEMEWLSLLRENHLDMLRSGQERIHI